MMRAGAPSQIERARCFHEIFEILRGYPSLGDFLAFQFAIDLNYSEMINFSEMEFVVAGPGARNGIRKCFVDTAGLAEDDVIRAVTELAEREFERLGLSFPNLWGRSLHLVDCQNLFCEVDKYARVVHPEFQGISKRARIKQRFVAKARPLSQWYPPKWRIACPAGPTESKISSSPSLTSANQGIFGFSPKAE
jgi:5-hmdU DNA kinase-like protein